MEFPIDRDNSPRFMTHLFRGIALLLAVVTLVLFAAGAADREDSISLLLFALATGTIIAWMWGGVAKGKIEIDAIGIIVTTKIGKQDIRWKDVEAISVSTGDEYSGGGNRLLMRLLLLRIRRPFVEVRLRQMLKGDPFRREWFTSGFGIPVFTTQVALFPQDVPGFVRAASKYLGQQPDQEDDWERPFGVGNVERK